MEAQQSGMADLAARLTKRLADKNCTRNLVFSPLSIYAVLALLAAGAGGATLEEVLRVLGARSRRELEDSVARLRGGPLRDMSESGGPSVAFAYGVWSDLMRPMKPAYRDTVVGTYKAEASAVDFLNNPEHATRQIDAWVVEATRNLITSAVPPGSLHRDTKLVLANAIYFKGKWDLPFYESQTKNNPFYRLDGTAVNVPFMTNSDSHYISEHDGFKVLKLLYKSSPYTYTQSHHCMCIFLPDTCDGLGSLLDKITSSPGFLREHLPQTMVNVGQFRVPKFELSFGSSLTTVLNVLGLRLPFSPEADLSEMLEDDGSGMPLLVQDVFQKAVIEVNEEGTKAAAVTMAFAYAASSAPCWTPPVDFVADHPFAYFIIEESDAVIFAGHVVDPSSGTGMVIPSPPPFQEYTTTKTKLSCSVYGTYSPVSPVYQHHPSVHKPTSPAYSPVSPVYMPTSVQYTPVSPPVYSPTSPAYSPVSPVYMPTSLQYTPVSPPVYRPTSLQYTPVSPPVYMQTSLQYTPVLPPVYRPTTAPFVSSRFSPAVYRPTPPTYTKLPNGVGQYRPQEVEEMIRVSLPKARAAHAARRREVLALI
ncbi:putative serpin-Z8 [Lolium rigidum]|uniref:putative serpin-Z8 n=1 Tax=Lolium rigidum TaxID=89674 RepID=UPI001F5C3CBC|nr:putative serpin-Z8 [Lolium rigidum]